MGYWSPQFLATNSAPGVSQPDGVSIVIEDGILKAASTPVDAEVVAGTDDPLVYTLEHAPNPSSSLQLFVGVIQRQGVGQDYTLTGNTITFAVIPSTQPLAWYRY